MRDIGKNIKALRIQKDMTQDELAEKLFVTRQTVSNYETGRSRPDVEMLSKIAEVLDTDANTVVYGLPGETDKKRMFFQTAAACLLCILLVLPYPRLNVAAKEIMVYRFIPMPSYLLTFYYYPLMLLCIGWTSMQLLSLFTRLSSLSRAKSRWLLRICLIFSFFYVLMMASIFLPFTKPRWLIYVYYFLLGVWPEGMVFNAAHLFLPIGAILWLCGVPLRKAKNQTGKYC